MELRLIYKNRVDNYSITYSNNNKISKWYIFSKLLLIISIIYFFYNWFSNHNKSSVYFGLLAIIAFVIVYYFDYIFLKKQQLIKNLIRINNEELEAISGNYSAFETGEEYIDQNHYYSFDLDIFGKGSLFNAINRTITFEGKNKLSDWLKETNYANSEIIERQQAVKELEKMVDFRQQFRAYGIDKKLDFTSLTKKFEKIQYKQNNIKTIIYCIIIIATVFFSIGAAFSIFPHQIALSLFIFQLFLVGIKVKLTNKRYRNIDGYYKTMAIYDKLITLFEHNINQPQSIRLKKIKKQLIENTESAKTAFIKLKKLLARFDQRNNVIIAILSNGFFLSDLFLNIRYEKWINEFGDQVEDYKNALGELDALISLSNFSYNNPDFCFPVLSNNTILSANETGHPLIDANSRVCNDFAVHSQKCYYIVTGANMAGKSTFLRTIGVNLVLACNGAPVCAKNFAFKPTTLFSSMRTSDNLINHISYFQAELIRLKMLMDVTKTHQNTFIILDEILKGTNSKDKLTGSKLFLRKILNFTASGILATHDLALGELENEMPDNFNNICFEIEIKNKQIFYDYKLKNGVAQNLNATYLLNNLLEDPLLPQQILKKT
ncbi:MAG: hypothetical protein JXB17_12545 [Bacteroidales bacterium]|nr:hypothetical protein [Bacteroidales bacterium]